MPRQKNIGLTFREGQILERRKEDYEHYIGRSVTWAQFLSHVVTLGLAELGVYACPEDIEKKHKAFWVTCSHCHHRFPVAIAEPKPLVGLIPCPSCGIELVIDIVKHFTENVAKR